MNGVDYASLLELDKEASLRGKYFSLRLGPWELRGMPFVTIATLAEDKALLHEIVGRCFVNRPVLWSDLDSESCQHCLRALDDLRSLLAELEQRLAAALRSRDLVYKGIVTRWLEATTEAVAALGSLEGSGSERDEAARALVGEYRARVYGPVSALIQFLSPDDEWAEEARETFSLGREALGRRSLDLQQELEEARWHLAHPATVEGEAMEGEEDPLTWGIP
jgi:hypothetical protein